MAFTPEERQEVLDIVAEQSRTPQTIPQAQSPDDVVSLPGIDASGDYKMVRMEEIKDNTIVSISDSEIDAICT